MVKVTPFTLSIFSLDMFPMYLERRQLLIHFSQDYIVFKINLYNLFEQQRDSSYSRLTSARESPMASNKDWTPRSHYKPSGSRGYYPSEPLDHGGGSGQYHAGPSMEPARDTTASRDEPSISNASEMETEWVEQDEPGVYITIRQLADGTRELRRVRFRYYTLHLQEHVSYCFFFSGK